MYTHLFRKKKHVRAFLKKKRVRTFLKKKHVRTFLKKKHVRTCLKKKHVRTFLKKKHVRTFLLYTSMCSDWCTIYVVVCVYILWMYTRMKKHVRTFLCAHQSVHKECIHISCYKRDIFFIKEIYVHSFLGKHKQRCGHVSFVKRDV